MPIKPENRALYPANWTEIRASILKRADHKCEQCGVDNYSVGCRDEDGQFVLWAKAKTHAQAREKASDIDDDAWDTAQPAALIIVLTIAHMDHDPTHNEPANLKALCQRCHLRYDAVHHAETAARTRRMKSPQSDMFETAAG